MRPRRYSGRSARPLSFTVRSRFLPRAFTPHEGTIFLVPLTPSGFAVGVLARTDRKGRAFGYFFGPRVQNAEMVNITTLQPSRAALVCRFGDHGLHTRRWIVVGEIAKFDRKFWALPKFHRADDSKEYVYVTEYDDSLNCLAETLVPRDAADLASLPYEAQFGSAIVEHKLSKLLA